VPWPSVSSVLSTPKQALPARFWLFVVVSLWAALGTQVLSFGMAWQASGSSPVLAGWIVSAVVLPRLVFPVASGWVADRIGPAQTVVASALVTAMVAAATLFSASAIQRTPVLLVAVAFALGVASAFTIPASGVLPRLLVDPAVLPRALAVSTLGQQCASLLGPVLGGLAIRHLGLAGSAAAECLGAVGLAAYAVVLARGRRAHQSEKEPSSWWRELTDGFTLILRDRVLRALVLSLVAVAGFVLPLVSFLVPVLAREREWSAEAAGAIAAAFTVGSMTVTAAIARWNGAARPGRAAGVGLGLSATGMLVVTLVSTVPSVIGATALIGAGVGLYTGHLAPVMLSAAPASHLARVQGILLVAQSAPLLLTTLALGALADATSGAAAAALCSVGLALATVLVLASNPVRQLRRDPPSNPVTADSPTTRVGQVSRL
jgi:hypothetical protein